MAFQFVVPRELGAEALAEALASSFALRAGPRQSTERIFYDTFDGRLHRAGMSLIYADGRFTLGNGSMSEIARLDWPRAPDELLAGTLPDSRLQQALQRLADVRAVARLAHVRVRQQPLQVLDRRRKTVVRLTLEEPVLLGPGEAELVPRLVATGIRGYDKALEEVRRLLAGELGLEATDVSLQDEAVTRSGHAPGGVSSDVAVVLRADEPAPVAAARIGRRLLEVIRANLPGALAGRDSEFLHDLRVAVRRTRALQKGLRDSFPAESLAHSRSEFRWLQQVTGGARDLDVYLLEFEALRSTLPERNRDGLDLLLGALRKRRSRERRRMRNALRSPRAEAALRGWEKLLAEASNTPGADTAPPLSEVAGRRIKRVYVAMVKAGDKIDEATPPTALHELRKQGKELRYLLEFFASLYPAEQVKPMVRALKALQDSLGRFQDRQIQADLVRSLGEEVREQPDGVSALMTMGQLVERLDEQQAQARAEFAARFADFASPQNRALVRQVFK
ncbi:MAG TPA: CHAD domain-containing protein [Solirubrobacteraceae bacterium]|nr:CHAD domain-containing protein [Solirubrobacteraceae bacterium]